MLGPDPDESLEAPEDGDSLDEEIDGGLDEEDAVPPVEVAATAPSVETVYDLVHESGSQRLDVFLASRLGELSRSFIQKLIESGQVTLRPASNTRPKASQRLAAGQEIHVVVPPPVRLQLDPAPIPLEILYEDEILAVINKPAGLAAHPSPDQSGPTLVNALLYWLKDLSGIAGVERPGIVHRLDKDTTGVLVVAKNDRAHLGLAAQFKERKVHKTYQTITRGEPRVWEGRIDYPLGRSPHDRKKIAVLTDGRGRPATTDYRVLEVFPGYSLVECYPHTGRTHQIRVHLQKIGLPVAADKLYGREKRVFLSDIRRSKREEGERPLIERHALHACGLTFRHPATQEEMSFSAPLHDDMLALLHALQRYRSPR